MAADSKIEKSELDALQVRIVILFVCLVVQKLMAIFVSLTHNYVHGLLLSLWPNT